MYNPIVTLFAFAAVTLFHDCLQAQQAESKTVKIEQARNGKAFREAVFSKRSAVTIVSHNGVYEGTDDDLEMVLRSDGSVRITEFGFGVTSTNGKYVVNDDGTITIKPNGDPEWEPLRWSLEDELLVIRPPTKEVFFAYARRSGVPEVHLTDEAYTETYERWPLREIKARKESVTKR